MLINLRNAMMGGRCSPLPPGARWVEYLESTGTQYIDTGVYGDSDTVAEFSFAMTDSSRSDAGVFGARKAYKDDCFCTLRVQASNGAFWMHYGDEGTGANYISTVIGNTADWHTARLAKSWTIDNSSGTAGTFTFTTPTTLKLFAADMSTSNRWYAKCRVCYLRIYANGVLVRDFRPIAIGSKGYMLDMVSGQYLPYGNAGTGDFVLGPDVVPMTWQDGLQYNNVGTPIESATSSIGLDYIPITAGHSFTWRLGYGSSASADLIIYNANKERIDYWVARDRTVTISGAAAYMRISVLSSYKEQATVYDETAQKYVFANGMFLTGGAA